MRPRIDFAAGRFIHPARLHADEAVLDEVETPDAMLAAKVVERRQQSGGRHRLPVQRDAVAALEIDYDIFGGVGRILGIDRARIDIVGRLFPRVLRSEEHTSELQSLMRIYYADFCLKKKQKT